MIDPNIIQLLFGGLALLLVAVVVIVLFSRLRQRAQEKPAASVATPSTFAESTPPLPTVIAPPAITLEFTLEADEPVIFTLDRPVMTVGRDSDNDICLAEKIPHADTVSKHHARLSRDQEDYLIYDLNSANGLLVNGRHTMENLLQDGDRVQFGEAAAIFHRPLGSAPQARGAK